MVIVATRELVSVFSVYEAVMTPSPDEEPGETVHQPALQLVVQEVLDVTLNVVLPAGVFGTFWLGGTTVSVGAPAAWVTVTTIGVSVATVTVILAILDTVVGLTAYDATMVPFPVPDGVTMHHV